MPLVKHRHQPTVLLAHPTELLLDKRHDFFLKQVAENLIYLSQGAWVLLRIYGWLMQTIIPHAAPAPTFQMPLPESGKSLDSRILQVALMNKTPDQLASTQGLRSLGFEGYRTVASLRDEGLDGIPEEPGVYLIIRTNTYFPRFLKAGTGGRFKGGNPNVSLSKLRQEWVEGALVLYVGQAGSNSKGTLRKRIDLLIKFGEGKPVGHRGGRLVWQLADADELVVCWKAVQNEDPQNVESKLIQNFKTFHKDRRPFANLRD